MKYLKIENNKAYYQIDAKTENWVELDKINKDDLMVLLNKAIESEFKMDEYREDLIGNKAHQIIYKNIHEKFKSLVSQKTRFKDESDALYKSAIEKYHTMKNKF